VTFLLTVLRIHPGWSLRLHLMLSYSLGLMQCLTTGNAIVQMDFAENFSCCSADEVQSAYWNSSAVTLHPVVVYFKNENSPLLLLYQRFLFFFSRLPSQPFSTVHTWHSRLVFLRVYLESSTSISSFTQSEGNFNDWKCHRSDGFCRKLFVLFSRWSPECILEFKCR
jgi:hypothetical protein